MGAFGESGGSGSLGEALDRVRDVVLLQLGELVVVEGEVDGGDSVVKMVQLGGADDGEDTAGRLITHANATWAGRHRAHRRSRRPPRRSSVAVFELVVQGGEERV